MLKSLHYPFFKVQLSSAITGEDLKNLRKLYAPILGSDSILLYEYLKDLVYDGSGQPQFHDFSNLTFLLNMDIKALNNARIKLESVSLISTMIDNYNHITLFIIEKPLNKEGFKRNLFLAKKLIKIMGKQNFENLVGKEKNIYLNKASHLLDASATFEEVFVNDHDDNSDIEDTYEYDLSELNNEEAKEYIQGKLDLNTFDYPNKYEAILKTDSKLFYSQISGAILNTKISDLIDNSKIQGMNDACINLIFYYAFEVNDKINYNYVKKIIDGFIKDQEFSFEKIEKILDKSENYKNKNVISKKNLYKTTYIESLKNSKSKLV